MEIELEISYTENGSWHKVDVMHDVYLEVLKTGMFEGKAVHSVRLWSASTPEDEDKKLFLIYDVLSAKQGNQPWRIS